MQGLGKDAPRIKLNKKFGFHCKMPVSARNLCAGVGSPLYGRASVAGDGRGCNEHKERIPDILNAGWKTRASLLVPTRWCV